MSYFHRSVQTARLVLVICVLGILPQTTEQLPVREGFNLLLYPVSVMGPYGSQTVLIPVTEQNTQRSQTPDNSKISAQSGSKPLNLKSGLLQPATALDLAPSPAPVPSESLVQQGQMSNFIPSNVPLQVYSLVQQAVISDSGSSEEGAAAQVIYMVPISVDSPSMGVMEPNPEPGHLQVPVSTTAPAAPPDAQGQLGRSAGTERPLNTNTPRVKQQPIH
ncbi:uncharacterized protein si:ch211-149b19.4 [Puntigrus tetrazona]|uniref:uncharacterized protein si:ch211-149b19.4 n=1 Tax=Puntigrus tetrazona TaxID=1606681 RepID=UPI001C8A4CDE|nr:uncharacterized protein si:ch211-149b19.4 [Puntigrus tetrazona]